MEKIREITSKTISDESIPLSIGDMYSIALMLQGIMITGAGGNSGVAGFLEKVIGIDHHIYASFFIGMSFMTLSYKDDQHLRGWLLMPLFFHTIAAIFWSVYIGLGNAHPVPFYVMLSAVMIKVWWLGKED